MAGETGLRRPVLFPDQYCWYVLVCALDVMLTATIIERFGGIEVNTIADRVIEAGGLTGLLAFKFASVALVVGICEAVGRRRRETGRRLSEWAVAISAMPVVLGLVQVAAGVAGGRLPM
ncbi:MAG: DUF5658 family protein [Phycisphaerales bacterium]